MNQEVPEALLKEILDWIKNERFGNLQINFAAGRIGHINRNESIKLEEPAPKPKN